jgi:glycosyltransferase involved in cell wall biosynthesis
LQSGIKDYCEIVVCDNDSHDGTRETVQHFGEKHGNLKYLKNDKNVGAGANLLQAVEAAEGKYALFLSDKAVLRPGILDKTLSLLREHEPSVLFMLNGHMNGPPEMVYSGLDFDGFVSIVSFWSTCVSEIIVSKRAFDRIEKTEQRESRLIQTYWLFQIIDQSPESAVCNAPFIVDQDIGAKSGYNLFEVFITNYLGLYKPYLDSGSLRGKTYSKEKRKLLLNFVFPWFLQTVIFRRHKYDTSRAYRIITSQYGLVASSVQFCKYLWGRCLSFFLRSINARIN